MNMNSYEKDISLTPILFKGVIGHVSFSRFSRSSPVPPLYQDRLRIVDTNQNCGSEGSAENTADLHWPDLAADLPGVVSCTVLKDGYFQ